MREGRLDASPLDFDAFHDAPPGRCQLWLWSIVGRAVVKLPQTSVIFGEFDFGVGDYF